jgi:signal transduction histidine kinase/ActR/RegA family two-component response regulator
MTILDLPTVNVVCCIVSLVVSLALLTVHASSRTYPGFQQWVGASLAAFAALALLALINLNVLPAQPTTLAINLVFFCFPVLLARGLRLFAGRPPQDWIAYVVAALVAGVAVFFSFVQPDANLRVFLLSLLLAALFADCALLVRHLRSFAHPLVKGGLIAAFGALSVWNLLRMPLALGVFSSDGTPVSPTSLALMTTLVVTAANIGISVGVILLNFARASETLREYQGKLAQAMDAAKLGHWEFEVASGMFTFDENFYHLLGTSSTREGGFRMHAADYARRFIPPEEAPVVAEEVRRAIETADPQYSRQLVHRFLRTDGSTRVMAVRIAIQKNAEGRTVRTYGLNQDITEQAESERQHRALEEQLRHAQKLDALGTLAGGIAHDFNNIITGIMGNLQLAEMELAEDHPARARLREADRAARRARDHVARVLTFSRRYQGDRAVIPLGPVVQEAVQLLRASLPANLEIHTRIAPGCPLVRCDTAQIHQVVMNLGTNAAHAMRGMTGRLDIELEPVQPDPALMEQHPQVNASHRVRLVVRDTGAGMDQTVLARIFEPFFTTKAPGEGTGLGLAMVHGIVKDHEGAITVSSAVGQGTAFTLYFPAQGDAAGAAPASGSSPPLAPNSPFGGGRRILLVDDDESVLAVGQGILRRCGFETEVFANPAAALQRFQEAPGIFSAVISDLTMPGMNGVELARKVRAVRADIPFILASGYLHSEAHGGAQESGVTHFVDKPFGLDEFAGKLRAALGQAPATGSPPAA